MGLKQWAFGRWVGGEKEDAMSGKLGAGAQLVWRFLDGWKTWIWAVSVALHHAFPGLACWGYVDAAAASVHWDQLVPAVDPDALVQWGTFTVAVGHKLVKAVQQYKAGVPVVDLQVIPLPSSSVEPSK